jgi:hypothetical protein
MLKTQIRPTLVSSDDSVWKNETGFATQLLVDVQVLFACMRVSELGGSGSSSSSSSSNAPLSNKERQHFKLIRGGLPMSSRMALALRSSCSFRNGLAIKQQQQEQQQQTTHSDTFCK